MIKKFAIGFGIFAITACSPAQDGVPERNTAYDGPCVEFFKSKSPKAGDVSVRDSWEKKGMVVVELVGPAAAVNPIAKGAIPDSPAAAKHQTTTPAAGHCIVNPANGTMRLPTDFDHSWERDAG